MKFGWLLIAVALFVQSSPALAQDGSFRGRRFRPPVQDKGIQWDLMNKPGSGLGRGADKSGSSKLFSDSPADRPGRRLNFRNGSSMTIGSDGNKTIFDKNGLQSKASVINPDGTGVLSDGKRITKDDVAKSTTIMRPDGLGFETNADGSKIFKRSNGLETVKTPDGKVYMRDSKTKQPTGRELIK